MKVRAVDRRMTVRALRIEPEPRRRGGVESEVKLRNGGVTTEAHLSHILMTEHMPVRRTVRRMASRAAVDSRCRVLVDKRSALVGVAFQALTLLEPPKQCARRGGMRIVAGRAPECPFDKPVTLVEFEFCEFVVVASKTQPARWLDLADELDELRQSAQQRLRRLGRMLAVAVGAGEPGLRMRAAIEFRV